VADTAAKGAHRGRWLSLRRFILLLAVVAVVAGLLGWVVIPYIHELQKFESLELTSYWWTRNAAGAISLATIRLRNNGTKTVRPTDVFVNTTRIPPIQWAINSQALPPEWSASMYVAPEGSGFVEGAVYNLTVHSAGGGVWTFWVPVDAAHVGPETFAIRGVSFFDWRAFGDPLFADVCVENHDAIMAVVVARRINGTLLDTKRFWIRPTGDSALCIHFIFNWVENATYTFTLETACGNTYNYTKTAVE
jgi:hypothetical protein